MTAGMRHTNKGLRLYVIVKQATTTAPTKKERTS